MEMLGTTIASLKCFLDMFNAVCQDYVRAGIMSYAAAFVTKTTIITTTTRPALNTTEGKSINLKIILKYNASGVLISGGYNRGDLKSVEIYNPVTNNICSLPHLPEATQLHTQDGELACGGGGSTESSCVKWSSESGSWTQSHTLRHKRAGHVSWATEDGVYLMGGNDSSSWKTTELVKVNGSVEGGFSLKYHTR